MATSLSFLAPTIRPDSLIARLELRENYSKVGFTLCSLNLSTTNKYAKIASSRIFELVDFFVHCSRGSKSGRLNQQVMK